MTSTERTDPPLCADEATTLLGFLDYHRHTLLLKTADLDGDQLDRTHPPSSMTLGGMLKHLALVETSWFSEIFLGGTEMSPFDTVDWAADYDWDWHSAASDSPAQLRALLQQAIAESDDIVRAALTSGGLDSVSVRTSRRTGEPYNLRWIVAHMIEEYARHNGHADLIRESIDGLTGE